MMGKPYHGWSCDCDDCVEQDKTRGWRDGEMDDMYGVDLTPAELDSYIDDEWGKLS